MDGMFAKTAPDLLPWKFTDEDLVSIPIPADVLDKSDDENGKTKRKGWGSKLKDKFSHKSSFRLVQVTRGDYLKYFARDEQGAYIGTEPEEMGLRLIKERERQAQLEGAVSK